MTAAEVRPFELVGMHDGAVCEDIWGRRSYRSGEGWTGNRALDMGPRLGGAISGEIGGDRGRLVNIRNLPSSLPIFGMKFGNLVFSRILTSPKDLLCR